MNYIGSSKPKLAKRGWSELEKAAVMRYFDMHVHLGKLPVKKDIINCLEREAVLRSRTWRNIKDFVRNKIRKRSNWKGFLACINFYYYYCYIFYWFLVSCITSSSGWRVYRTLFFIFESPFMTCNDLRLKWNWNEIKSKCLFMIFISPYLLNLWKYGCYDSWLNSFYWSKLYLTNRL